MNLSDWIQKCHQEHGKGIFEVPSSGCCHAPLRIFLDTEQGQLVIACDKCEQPRMVFLTSPPGTCRIG